MKKLLLLATILMVFSLVLVACQTEPDAPVDTTEETPSDTPAQETEAPGEETTVPETQTTAPGEETTEPGEETTTPEEETDPPEETTQPEEPPVDPAAPIGVYPADKIATITGADPSNLTADCVTLEDGYLHVVPIGPDPYWYPFANVEGARYVAIRYRTDATGADIQMYIGSSGNGPSNDDSMLRQPVIADKAWHLAIFDTQEIIDKGLYNGTKVAYFRFDALEAGYMLDENGQPYKIEGTETWARYQLPEGCSIDIAYIAFFNAPEYAEAYDFENYKAPMWNADKAVVVAQAFDQLYKGAGNATNGDENLFAPGTSASWDNIADLTAGGADILTYWGWVGFKGELGQFGYQINGGTPIYSDDFAVTPEQPVIDAAMNGGADNASRMKIQINLAGLEGEYTVRTLYKNPDGVEVCLGEFKVILPVVSHTGSFVSNIDAIFAQSQDDKDLKATDLAQLFDQIYYGAGAAQYAIFNNGAPYYGVTSFTSMHTKPNGWYAYNINVVSTGGAEGFGGFFVRGVQAASLEGQFYGQDGNDGSGSSHGGAGIYFNYLGIGKLRINIKTFVDGKFIPNIYYVNVESSNITVVDTDSVITILAGDKKIATIEVIGTKVYDIKDQHGAAVSLAEDALAEKAILTLADGTVVELDNACVAAKAAGSDLGVATRTGAINFNAISLKAYNTVEIPDEFYAPAPKVNVAVGKPATSDNIENDTNIPANATDGNDATRYGALPNGEANLVVDLQGLYKLTELTVLFENASWSYTISVSADGETYTVIHEGAPHGAATVSLKGEYEARYLKFTRLDDTGTEGNHWFSIYEVYAYGVLIGENESTVPATTFKPETFAQPTADELAAGYTYDVGAGQFFQTITGVCTYADLTTLGATFQEKLQAAGFGSYAYFATDHISLAPAATGELVTYTFKIYDMIGNIATNNRAFLLLNMTGGGQNSAEVAATVVADADNEGVYYVTFSTVIPNGTDEVKFYMLEHCQFYVDTLTVKVGEGEPANPDDEEIVVVDKTQANMVGESLDSVLLNGGFYFPDGQAYAKLAEVNNTVTVTAGDVVGFRGWIGFDQPILALGCQVEDGEYYFDEFKTDTEAGVLEAGGQYATRYTVLVPTDGADPGAYKLTWVAVLEDYTVVNIHTVTIVVE